MNLCGLIENAALRDRINQLAASAGWSCWLGEEPARVQRMLDQVNPPADLVVTDVVAELPALQTAAGRTPVLLILAAPPADCVFATTSPEVSDTELLLAFRTCVNAQRFRARFAALDRQEPITNLPRHDELLRDLTRQLGNAVGLLVIQIDHAAHLYAQLDPVSRSDLLGLLGEQVRRGLPPGAAIGFHDSSCFVAALTDTAPAAVKTAAESLHAALRRPIAFRGGELHLTASLGHAQQIQLTDPARLWSEAWDAMRRAVESGGNRIMGADQHTLADRLPSALAREEFALVLQPQFSIDGERLTGAEVLLRWHGLDVGELSPAQFIPLAESRGHMARLGDWVLEQASRTAATWLENRIQPIRLGINVSPQQFNRGAITAQIERLHAERWFDPGVLELEIPHESMLQLIDTQRDQLYRLRDLGVRFALDQLGRGLMDAERLLRCPADTLKIDRRLIDRIELDPRARELVESICTLGQRFELRVVAVGVERDSQLAFLQRVGCGHVQGYLFSPPVSLAGFGELLLGSHTRRRTGSD
jgi:EAL domain-containing protein (putative c-di-GMP-specific phosphodiesterase class I)/GGDEF domain-containing protein